MHVRLQPGMSYPAPADRVNITEQNIHPGIPNGRGLYQHHSQRVDPDCQRPSVNLGRLNEGNRNAVRIESVSPRFFRSAVAT